LKSAIYRIFTEILVESILKAFKILVLFDLVDILILSDIKVN